MGRTQFMAIESWGKWLQTLGYEDLGPVHFEMLPS